MTLLDDLKLQKKKREQKSRKGFFFVTGGRCWFIDLKGIKKKEWKEPRWYLMITISQLSKEVGMITIALLGDGG